MYKLSTAPVRLTMFHNYGLILLDGSQIRKHVDKVATNPQLLDITLKSLAKSAKLNPLHFPQTTKILAMIHQLIGLDD
jgi:hypothetical protein